MDSVCQRYRYYIDKVCQKYILNIQNRKKQKKHLVKGAFVGRAGFEPAKM